MFEQYSSYDNKLPQLQLLMRLRHMVCFPETHI